MIAAGAPLELKDPNQNTPLHYAARKGYLHIIRAIISKGGNINAQNNKKETPIITAILNDQFDAAIYLTDQKDINLGLGDMKKRSPMHHAVLKNNESLINHLLKKNAPFDLPDKDGNTPLILALKDSQQTIVQTLFSNGADVLSTKDKNGITPLHLACQNGLSTFVSTLLDKGVPVDAYSATLATPLYTAIKYNQLTIAFQLLELSSAISTKTKEGRTLMHCVAENGNIQLAEKISAKGAPLDDPDNHKITPLMVAFQCKKPQIAQFLLSKDVSILSVDEEGNTIVHYASICAKRDVFTSILEKGGGCLSIHQLNNKHQTPLFKAVENAYNTVVEYLIKYGANTNL